MLAVRSRPVLLLAIAAVLTSSCGPVALGAAASSAGGGGGTTTEPSIALLSPAGPVEADRTLTITYVTTPRDTACEYQVDGGLFTPAAANGTISVTVAADGPHRFTIRFAAQPDVRADYDWFVDTVAPLAPSGLAATAERAHELTATWAPSGDPAPGSDIDRYEASFVVDGNSVGDASPTGTSLTLGGLPAARRGLLRVQAIDRAGNRSAFAEIAARTDVGGDGTFAAAVTRATGLPDARAVQVADCTRDRIADLLLVRGGGGATELVCLRGNGSDGRNDGTFTPVAGGSAVPTGALLAVADLDGDRNPDVVAAGAAGGLGEARVLRGAADGTFATGASYPLGGAATAITLGDFDADGKQDLVVGSGVGVQWFRGLGDATFAAAGSNAFANARGIAVLDADDDRNADLVLAGDGGVAVALGQGGNVFGAPQTRLAADVPTAALLRMVDVNGDGIADPIVVAGDRTAVKVAWSEAAAGCANGNFAFRNTYAVAGSIRDLAVGDLDGDAVRDLVVVAEVGGQCEARLLRGLAGADRGRFAAVATAYPCGVAVDGIALADVDGRGTLDVVAPDAAAGAIAVLRGQGGLGRGDGTFAIGWNLSLAGPVVDVECGDLDRDGIADLAFTTDDPSPGVHVAYGNGSDGVGDGTFGAPVTLSSLPWSRPDVLLVDANGDRILDLLTADRDLVPYQPSAAPLSITTFLGNADGTFQAGATTTVGMKSVALATQLRRNRVDVAVAGFDFGVVGNMRVVRDDRPTACTPTTQFSLLPSFQLQQNSISTFHKGANSGDFDRDGLPDLVVVGAQAVNGTGTNQVGSCWVRFGTAIGGVANAAFGSAPGVEIPTGYLPEKVHPGDFDEDGKLDLFFCNTGFTNPPLPASVSVVFGNGDRTFDVAGTWSSAMSNMQPNCYAATDFDGNGLQDVAVALNNGTQVRLFRGGGAAGGRTAPFTTGSATVVPDFSGAFGLATADVDADGIADLVVGGKGQGASSTGRLVVLLGKGSYPLPLQ